VNDLATKERLKIVVLYDANHNEYSISAHNQSADEAQRIVEEWQPQLVPGSSLIVLDQSRQHRTPDADHCEACRNIVARSANISPQPAFKRRK
jgi:hypothetical protein